MIIPKRIKNVAKNRTNSKRRISHRVYQHALSFEQDRSKCFENQPFGTFESKRGTTSFVSWEKPTEGEDGFVCIYLQGKKRNEEIVLKSPHAIDLAFNSGWFEYKVARLLSHWKKAKNIYMNCRFPFKSNVDKNEVDIIVNAGNKLLFVECKTQINKTTDIDKFNSVVRAYGGTASKALFVTDAIMTDVAKKNAKSMAS